MWCAQSSSIVNKRGDQCNNTRNIHKKNNSTQHKSARKGEKELISCRSFLIMLLQFLNFIFFSSLSTSPFCAFFLLFVRCFFRFTLPLALAYLSVAIQRVWSAVAAADDARCASYCLKWINDEEKSGWEKKTQKRRTERETKIYETFWDSLELNNLRRDL